MGQHIHCGRQSICEETISSHIDCIFAFWLQYAAFYSDSEHEVLEVTSGMRVIIAYKLLLRPIHGYNMDPSYYIQEFASFLEVKFNFFD